MSSHLQFTSFLCMGAGGKWATWWPSSLISLTAFELPITFYQRIIMSKLSISLLTRNIAEELIKTNLNDHRFHHVEISIEGISKTIISKTITDSLNAKFLVCHEIKHHFREVSARNFNSLRRQAANSPPMISSKKHEF